MRNFRWICWYLWEGLPTLLAFPITPLKTAGTSDFWSSQWENHWPSYVVGTLGFVALAFTLAGCLCCQRQRRPKGFQDDAGTGKEFKDGSTAATETTIERVPSSSLELEVPRILTSSREKIQFDEISCNYVEMRSAIKPPSSSLYSANDDADYSSRDHPCNEWYEGENFPREKLKYLREIGRGWFGKVVEGTTMLDDEKTTRLGKNRGVVVRILTEGATSREKSWFLGESTPYLKLRHPNILELLGFCLETDPYLLLFESCPIGDMKQFLTSNRENGDALRKENLPTRMALNIANALEHMHENSFAHTDLSARNCLVAHDLTAKLGDYGTGVEKYPSDYYVVGDRALPIRWSAPESLECTETTIETRAITPLANIWSYGILLWEIASWAERPYDDLGDEQVIEMIFSINNDNSTQLLKKLILKCDFPPTFRDALEATWKFIPSERSSLGELKELLCGKRIEDFERRWENLRPNGSNSVDKSASLQDLRGSMDSELWQANSSVDKNSLKANFRLGPQEPVIGRAGLGEHFFPAESGSETEEESWRSRVERGAYTDKVKQKSKSVADLMVLVHIDSDSDLESSLGPPNIDKTVKKRLPPFGSDGDLRSAVIAGEFDEALRKLRDPTICNVAGTRATRNITENLTFADEVTDNTMPDRNKMENVIVSENMEKPKLLTLTNQGKTPILRLSFGQSSSISNNLDNEETQTDDENRSINNEKETITEINTKVNSEIPRNEEHVLRLVSKGDPDLPLLRYFPDRTSTPVKNHTENHSLDSFLVVAARDAALSSEACEKNGAVDVELWNDALAHELEKKNPVHVEDSRIFDESIDSKIDYFDDSSDTAIYKEKSTPSTPKSLQNFSAGSSIDKNVLGFSSAPETPRRNCSSSKIEDLRKMMKRANFYHDEDDMITSLRLASETPFGGNYNVPDHDQDSSTCEDLEERMIVKDSAPDTPQSRGNYSVGNGDEDSSSTGEELEPGIIKRSAHEGDDEEDRKHLSTPDDERSSDSGFRDKESCEEEESPIPSSQATNIILSGKKSSESVGNSSPLSASAEEEQMRILLELDTILDAEYYGSFRDSEKSDETEMSLENIKIRFDDTDEIADKIRSISESHESTESTEILKTVRANSCEPNFLDNFMDKKGSSKEDSKYDFLNEDISADTLESTEADSVSEFFKIGENRLNSKANEFSADSSSESPLKSDKNLSTDSSIEIARLNFDSSSSKGKNETTDFSFETRSDLPKNESTSEISPMETDRNSSTDLSLDLRLETSDSPGSSGKTDRRNLSRDGIPEMSEETENTSTSAGNIELHLSEQETSRDDQKNEKYLSNPNIYNDGRTFEEKSISPSRVESDNSTSSSGRFNDENSPLQEISKIPLEPEVLMSSVEGKACMEALRHEISVIHREIEGSGRSIKKPVQLNSLPHDYSKNLEFKENSKSSVENEDERNTPLKRHGGVEVCLEESPSKNEDNPRPYISIDPQRDTANSEVERWSSRENIDEINDNDEEEDSSTMSLRSDNSYVSFGLDEEFVTAIRNELREKLPRAQMSVEEALDPHDEKETASMNPETTSKNWAEQEEIEENLERSSVDISIRYNIYGTPLSPIMEERESAGTSESLICKEDSGDASIASRVSALSEDVLVVDTRTNRAIIVQASSNGGNPETSNSQHDDDRDTSQGDFSDDENLEYPQTNLNRGLESKRFLMGSGGAPLPSPEEETKWQQQFPLPLQMQDDLMSTSFGTDRDWDSQDDEEGEDDAEDGEEDEEENSSSSGEFVWKRYDESHGDLENVATRSPPNKPKFQESEVDLDEEEEEGDEEDDEEEEEFTPSAWDATLAPHRSALRSPEKNPKSGDQKKSVWFKKQRYHCVYEYPKETPIVEGQGQAATTWEPTLYADWEEMMDEPRLDIYPIEYDESNRAGDEEFYVSSSNRPFQFQSGEGKYVSQFFPGASTTLLQHENQHQMSSSSSSSREADDLQSSQDEVDCADAISPTVQPSQTNGSSAGKEIMDNQQQTQLGELRHTRDRLKLNLLTTSSSAKTDEETGTEIRAGDRENLERTGKAHQMIDIAEKSQSSTGKIQKSDESREIADETREKGVRNKEGDGITGKLDTFGENIQKSVINAERVEKMAESLLQSLEKSSQENIKFKTVITAEGLSTDVESCEKDESNDKLATVDSKVVTGGESSTRTLDNLAVNEASKAESNDKGKPKEALSIAKEKLEIDVAHTDVKVKSIKESNVSPNDEKIQAVESTIEVSKNFGDQGEEESMRSRDEIDAIKSDVLHIPKLGTDESLSSTNANANSEIVIGASKNNSSKNGENIGDIEKTEMVQSSMQS